MANPTSFTGNIRAGGILVTIFDAAGVQKGTQPVYLKNASPKKSAKTYLNYGSTYAPADFLAWTDFATISSGDIIARSGAEEVVPELGDYFIIADGIATGMGFRIHDVEDKRTEHQPNMYTVSCTQDPSISVSS